MNKATWSFGTNKGGGRDGFRNSGIHLFGNRTFESMIREGIQNSIDAKDDSVEGPVHVAFTIDDFNPQIYKELEDLVEFLTAGLSIEQKLDRNSEATKWYQDSINKIVRGKCIQVLGVHDGNTIGLEGTADRESDDVSPYTALVASQGINVKRDGDSLGGFGHGSNAAFGMSDLRTVFYLSPSTDENGLEVTRFEGHSILQTLKIDGKRTNKDGFYGIKTDDGGTRAMHGDEIPTWFSNIRNKAVGSGKGTSVFIFEPQVQLVTDFWKALQTCVIANFAYAILKGKLEVSIAGDQKITADNLKLVFNSLIQENEENYYGLSEYIAKSMESAKTVILPDRSGDVSRSVVGFGQYDWFLRVGESVKGRNVGIARDPGMLITRDAQNLQGFNGLNDFDLFVCVKAGSTNPETGKVGGGAKVIKAMEDPSHSLLVIDWVKPDLRTEYKSSYKKFTEDVRNFIKEFATPELKDVIDIDIEDLLGDDPLGEKLEAEGLDVVKLRPGRRKRLHFQSPKMGGTGTSVGTGTPPAGEGGNGGPGGGQGNPPQDPAGTIRVAGDLYEKSPLRALRVVPLGEAGDGWSRIKIIVNAEKKGKRRIALLSSGESLANLIEISEDVEKVSAPVFNLELIGSESGRVEQVIKVRTESLDFALSGEIYYGV